MSAPQSLEDIVIVSNREPFSHTYADGGISVSPSPGGLTSALDSVAGALGGTWVAWGSGDADFDPDVVDDRDTVADDRVDADYTLRRVRLTDEEVARYYYGYSNRALWPLCHIETAHTQFDRDAWDVYREVNERFATAVADAAEDNVWIHDYHLTLLPRYLRENGGSDLTLVHFWHIPWPPVDVFEICPQRDRLLRGLLANDAVGFHVDRFRRRFLECVDALVPGAGVDWSSHTVRLDGDRMETYVVPAGVDVESIERTLVTDSGSADGGYSVYRQYGIDPDGTLAVGIDRLDYTKGVVERLDALDRALTVAPELRGDLTYLQVASRSRERIPAYRQYHDRVLERVEAVNDAHRTGDWQPVVYTDETLSGYEVFRTLEQAEICIVSSRRDGLNLVAEEFVAASRNSPGELLLSEFAGAAEVLGPAATRINPFDTTGFTDTLIESVATSTAEREQRTAALLEDIRAASLDRWVSDHVAVFESV